MIAKATQRGFLASTLAGSCLLWVSNGKIAAHSTIIEPADSVLLPPTVAPRGGDTALRERYPDTLTVLQALRRGNAIVQND